MPPEPIDGPAKQLLGRILGGGWRVVEVVTCDKELL